MPWSTAAFARSGGTSATSVNANSETIAPAVRSGYGRASPTSIPRRLRVWAHDQSATLPPRSSLRCEPACQTFTPTPRSCRNPDLLEQAELVDLAEDRALLEQLVLRSLRHDAAVLQHDDPVGERDRRQAVRDHYRGAAAHRLRQACADQRLR